MNEMLKLFEFTANKTQELAQSQSVTGTPMVIDGVTVIPAYKISCGFTGGGTDWTSAKKNNTLAAGTGAKVTKTPLSFLAVEDGKVRILHVASEQVERVGLADALAAAIALFKEKSKNKNGAAD